MTIPECGFPRHHQRLKFWGNVRDAMVVMTCVGTMACLGSRAQTAPLSEADRVSTQTVQVGDTAVRINVESRVPGGPVYINLHRNESTSVELARELLATEAGALVTIHHRGQRFIDFKLDGLGYTFDPNRIFTTHGIKTTLQSNGSGRYSDDAAAEVQKLSNAVLALVNDPPTAWIVALHNNSGASYSFESYRGKGKEVKNARRATPGIGRSTDAFFVVTTEALEQALGKERFNVVLQSSHPADDGSLSVWAQQSGRSYINVEAKLNEVDRQRDMLGAVVRGCKKLTC